VEASSGVVTFFVVLSVLKSWSLKQTSRRHFGNKSEEQGECSVVFGGGGAETALQRAPCELENCHGEESNR
jgi:hypothetical protein